VRRQLFAFERG